MPAPSSNRNHQSLTKINESLLSAQDQGLGFFFFQNIAYLQRRGTLWQPTPFPLQKDIIKSNDSGPQL